MYPNQSNTNNLAFILVIILAVFAVSSIAFGAFTFINSSQTIAELNETISEQKTIINNTHTLNTADNSSTNNYIYIGEWGIKIAIPEDLSWVGYTFTPSNTTSTISVYGAKGQYNTRPSFLNLLGPASGYGFITRAPIGYGLVGGIKVFSNNGYDYYYEILQQSIAENPEEATSEAASKALVETMLTTTDNYSSI